MNKKIVLALGTVGIVSALAILPGFAATKTTEQTPNNSISMNEMMTQMMGSNFGSSSVAAGNMMGDYVSHHAGIIGMMGQGSGMMRAMTIDVLAELTNQAPSKMAVQLDAGKSPADIINQLGAKREDVIEAVKRVQGVHMGPFDPTDKQTKKYQEICGNQVEAMADIIIGDTSNGK